MQSKKEKNMAQSDWSYNSIEHLKAQMHIKSKKTSINISKPIAKPEKTTPKVNIKTQLPKLVDYRKHQARPTLYEFRKWLHNPEYRFLILDFEFYVTGNKTTKENIHIFQAAGQVFNDFDRFNYYNLTNSMKSDKQLELLRATNAQYSELKPQDNIANLSQRISTFAKQHNITHIISWDNSTDIAQLRYWENHQNTNATFDNKVKWIDLATMTGRQLNDGADHQQNVSLKNFYKTLGLSDNNLTWHHADQDVQAINQICHVYYDINDNPTDLY